jgi:NADPH:quinone reductase-like Zn-dependent oxidoreductase
LASTLEQTPVGRLESPQHREKKETMSTQTWFITGASSGLGASVANAALRAGYRVAVTARDKVRLEKLTEAHPDAVLPLIGRICPKHLFRMTG